MTSSDNTTNKLSFPLCKQASFVHNYFNAVFAVNFFCMPLYSAFRTHVVFSSGNEVPPDSNVPIRLSLVRLLHFNISFFALWHKNEIKRTIFHFLFNRVFTKATNVDIEFFPIIFSDNADESKVDDSVRSALRHQKRTCVYDVSCRRYREKHFKILFLLKGCRGQCLTAPPS